MCPCNHIVREDSHRTFIFADLEECVWFVSGLLHSLEQGEVEAFVGLYVVADVGQQDQG